MFLNPQSDPSEKVTSADNSQPYFIQQDFSASNIIQDLLDEITRVKGLIKQYNCSTDTNSHSKAELLEELVVEAYNSLVNYDVSLMNKYYYLLQNCD